MSVDNTNQSGFIPLESEDIEEYLEGKNDGWTIGPEECKKQALHLINASWWKHETYEDRMAMLAEAQVWATLAASREG